VQPRVASSAVFCVNLRGKIRGWIGNLPRILKNYNFVVISKEFIMWLKILDVSFI
jgi:hypothetical protein